MIDITEIMKSDLLMDLQCDCCNNTLSVPPILIDATGKNVCGRCKSNVCRGLFAHNSHYEVLAQQFSFPCRYGKDGCLVKTPFNKVKHHEDGCPYRTVICKRETCCWSGIPTELVLHFQEHHGDGIIRNAQCVQHVYKCVQELLHHNRQQYILVAEGFYFLVEYSIAFPTFTISISSLNLPYNHYKEIIFDFILITKDAETTTTIVNSITVNSSKQIIVPSSLDLTFSFSARLSDITPIENILKKITCPNCSSQMFPPILRCPEGHTTCVNCTENDYDYCKICDEDEKWFRRVYELELLAAFTLYKCKWKGCDNYFSINKIEYHQITCCKRVYMCLHCPYWNGSLDELPHHDESCSSKTYSCSLGTTYSCPLLLATEVTVQGTEIKINEDYCEDQVEYGLVAHQELFIVIFHRNSSEIEIAVCNCGPASLLSWYDYEVHLQHIEDPNFSSNKVYNKSSQANGRYTVKIPECDVAAFSSSTCFKLTVKIRRLSGDEKKKSIQRYLNLFKLQY